MGGGGSPYIIKLVPCAGVGTSYYSSTSEGEGAGSCYYNTPSDGGLGLLASLTVRQPQKGVWADSYYYIMASREGGRWAGTAAGRRARALYYSPSLYSRDRCYSYNRYSRIDVMGDGRRGQLLVGLS